MTDDAALRRLMQAMASADDAAASALLAASPALATAALDDGATRATATANFLTDIRHYVFAGDTALHVAAAAYRAEIARRLIELGADAAPLCGRRGAGLARMGSGRPGRDRGPVDRGRS